MNYPLAICGDPRTNHGTILAVLILALDGFLEEKDMMKAKLNLGGQSQHLGFNFMPNEKNVSIPSLSAFFVWGYGLNLRKHGRVLMAARVWLVRGAAKLSFQKLFGISIMANPCQQEVDSCTV